MTAAHVIPAFIPIGGLVFAQSIVDDLPGLLGDVAGPTTIVGAIVVADRYLARSRREALALARETATEANARLDAEQARWERERQAFEARIDLIQAKHDEAIAAMQLRHTEQMNRATRNARTKSADTIAQSKQLMEDLNPKDQEQ